MNKEEWTYENTDKPSDPPRYVGTTGMLLSWAACPPDGLAPTASLLPTSIDSNNDRIMAAQKYGGVRKSTGEVTVTYYGHMAFKITSIRAVWNCSSRSVA